MRLYHDSRNSLYRTPFGAVETGTRVTLRLDAADGGWTGCALRLWVDGKGEKRIDMTEERRGEDRRFSCTFTAAEPAVVWYHFILRTADGREVRYGAREGRTGGEGAVYDHEPPSFQLTVYDKRPVPAWYKNAVVYQIFPDVFARDEAYRARAAALDAPRNGPARRLTEDWYEPPFYERDDKGRVTRWDLHGGSLRGIMEKLPYLQSLGVTALYLNPVFEAASWHRYDTADYEKIDPLLGTEADFRDLCAAASKAGIRVILDGVFNHTGCDSRYFDKYGNYGGGAYGDPASPYRAWYTFNDTPAGYDCWWGVDDLPAVNEEEPSYRAFIAGPDGVVRRWLRAGASGFRLDVADELPDDFIAAIKTALTEEKPDGVLLGEVWEDASNKISYGKLRRYFLGDELDGVMNYPFRSAVLDFLTGKLGAGDMAERFRALQENYPPEAFYAGLNMLGSHDRPRVLTVLGDAPEPDGMSEEARRGFRLDESGRGLAKARLWLALLLQMTFPGVPCLYYGDEAGMEGYADPYNRGPYPWGREDGDTQTMVRNARFFRKAFPAFTEGDLELFACGDDVFAFRRSLGTEHFIVAVNRHRWESREVRIPAPAAEAAELVGGAEIAVENGEARFTLGPLGSAVIRFGRQESLARRPARGAGVLCHVTSVPNGGRPGALGAPAERFVDRLAAAGVRYWQVLPIHPTDEYGSPYAGASAFAGSVDLLGMSEAELRRAYEAFTPDDAYRAFERENAYWLPGYASFEGGDPGYTAFCQYLFDQKWKQLKAYANERGVKLIGDIPMFVSARSADAHLWPQFFKLDGRGAPAEQAGVPPDLFAAEGQLWGNPLYDWEALRQDGFRWWLERLGRLFRLFDYVRLDHFRGFEAVWSVPAGKKPKEGRWVPAMGLELFRAAYERFGPLPVIAEDLGMITPAVRALLDAEGFPGMDVLQFYDGDVFAYRPPRGKLAYTGTHDNDTLAGWCEKRFPERDARACAAALEEIVFASAADVVVLPLQDAMLLGSAARMNVPGTEGGNWAWQAREEDMDGAMDRLAELIRQSERG